MNSLRNDSIYAVHSSSPQGVAYKLILLLLQCDGSIAHGALSFDVAMIPK
jgi:hypothetical protein